jgi:hypothetical protein
MVHAGYQDTLKGNQDDQAIPKYVVVQSAEKLRTEKRREAALSQERKLAGI